MPKLASWVLSHPHPTLCQAVNSSELQRQIQAPTLANPTQRSRWSGGGITHSWLGKRAASSQRVFCSVLLLICGHVWNLTVLLVSLLFSYFVFLTRFFLQEQPNSYSIQDPTPEECSAPAGFRREGWQTCLEIPPTPRKQWGVPGSQLSFCHRVRANTALSRWTRKGPHKKPTWTYLQFY